MKPSTVVIVGANLAGGRAAETLRAEGFDGRVVLVGEEADRPYERPPLSKQVLRGEREPEKTYLRPPEWYAENAIELRLATRAERLDPAGTVKLSDGETISFGACLLATGGLVRRLDVPGAGGPNVRYLRTLADATALRDAIASRPRVVVVGAGFIGAEVAASARTIGCDVTMLEIAPLPLSRVFGEDIARVYADLHRDHGVDLMLSEGVDRIEKDAVIGSSGRRYPADLVVVGVGIEPADELAREAGIDCDNGIVVDERCRTSAPNVFAAGDVAHHPNPILGRRIRVEHFQNAQDQGAAAARSILGRTDPFSQVPWFWSDQYDVHLQMLGHPSSDDDVIVRGALVEREFTAIYLHDDLITGAVAVNRASDIAALRRLIERRVRVERALLADEDLSLRSLIQSTA